MARYIEVRTGATGYRDQLDRVRRYLARMGKSEEYKYIIEYQDDVWSFFQNCWHLKDWVKRDPLIPQDKKDRIIAAVHASRILAIANDVANGTKHLELRGPKAGAGAYYSHTHIKVSGPKSELETLIDVDGIPAIFASVIAKSCVEEWEKILAAEGLPIEPMGT